MSRKGDQGEIKEEEDKGGNIRIWRCERGQESKQNYVAGRMRNWGWPPRVPDTRETQSSQDTTGTILAKMHREGGNGSCRDFF